MKAEAGGHFGLSSPALAFHFNANSGRFSIGPPNAPPIIQNALALARFDTGTISTATLRLAHVEQKPIETIHGPAERLSIHFQPAAGVQLTLHVSLYQARPFLTLQLTTTNVSQHAPYLRELVLLSASPRHGSVVRLGAAPTPLSFFKNGYQSWSYTGVRHAGQRDVDTRLGTYTRPLHFNPATPISKRRGSFWSEMFGALIDPGARKAIVAGQIGCADQFARIGADTHPRQAALSLVCDLDGIPLAPGQSIAAEEMLVQLIDLPADNPFADYLDAVARQMNPRIPAAPNAGWCSWYYYFPRVREADVIASLRSANDRQETIPIGLIQIDDGYQTKTGDWLSVNEKFPRGMKWLAGQIRDSGRTPGLWLAPFIAVQSSHVVRQHPDWLICNARGKPAPVGKNWNEMCFALDVTQREAQDYVRGVIETIVREWGYSYLKLDFLYAGAAPGVRHDAALTRAQALRRGLELIRQTAGDGVFLLGCGCPLGPAIGLVDAMRIGPDIAPEPEPTWLPRYKGVASVFKDEMSLPAGRNAARNTLARSGMHRTWWLNDPDCLIVREARHMNDIEVRSWASLVGLSGGLLVLSDDLPRLSPQRQHTIASLLPVSGETALPLDLFEREMPELYVLRQRRDWGSGVVAGLFNWSDRPRRKVIDLALLDLDPFRPHHAFEFWSGEYRRIENGELDLGELPAHGCAVVAIRPVLDRPHLVATTFHLTMGGEIKSFEIKDRGLLLELQLKRRAAGEIWIAGRDILRARVNGQSAGVRHAAAGVWTTSIEVDGSAAIEFTFR